MEGDIKYFFEHYKEGENVYKDYAQGKILTVTQNYLEREYMYIPGYTTCSVCLDGNTFGNIKDIKVLKHACYMPPFAHSHTFFECIYVYSGFCENYIGDSYLHINEGDLLIIPPGTSHMLSCMSDSAIINILLRKELFVETFQGLLSGKNKFSSFFWQNLSKENNENWAWCKRLCLDSVIKDLMEILIYEGFDLNGTKDERLEVKQNILRGIFSCVTSSHLENISYSTDISSESDNIREILAYIRKNYNDIRLQELADRFHYSVSYLSRLIKKETGRSFLDIVNNIRFDNACALLSNTDLPVSEIALKTGYGRSDTFYKMIKKRTGLSPKEYRLRAW